jgi:hypothetical protein
MKRGFIFSLLAFVLFALLFASQLKGHGSNTGGVFPAPILLIGLIGMPVAGLFVLVFGIAALISWGSDSKEKKDEEA